MTKEELAKSATLYAQETPHNVIRSSFALDNALVGTRLYDAPLLGVAAASDPLFSQFKLPRAVGPLFMTPAEWLPGAASVVSLFFPTSRAIRQGNAKDLSWPSAGWLHARIEGQEMINKVGLHLVKLLAGAGRAALCPATDARFQYFGQAAPENPNSVFYTSNWSERHVAYACGLGTFGLSKGLITRRGVAGRFVSLVTTLPLAPDQRSYRGLYDYCSRCGACAANCPAGAITLEAGKNHQLCDDFLRKTLAQHQPRYGCGKCQVRVPCGSRPAAGA